MGENLEISFQANLERPLRDFKGPKRSFNKPVKNTGYVYKRFDLDDELTL
jgi:hypothetical protein